MGHHIGKIVDAYRKSQMVPENAKGEKPERKIEELIKLSLNDLIGLSSSKGKLASDAPRQDVDGMKDIIKN